MMNKQIHVNLDYLIIIVLCSYFLYFNLVATTQDGKVVLDFNQYGEMWIELFAWITIISFYIIFFVTGIVYRK